MASWLEILRTECERSSKLAVAKRLGISRSAVSLVLAGRYPAKTTDGVELRVRQWLERIDCPHLKQILNGLECRAYQARPLPHSSARELRHWRACQCCVLGRDEPDGAVQEADHET